MSFSSFLVASRHYNAMIYPLLYTNIIWYQGERDAQVPANIPVYSCMLEAMVRDWRNKWYHFTQGGTDQILPFGLVQVKALELSYSV